MKCPRCQTKMEAFRIQGNNISYKCNNCGAVRDYCRCPKCDNHRALLEIIADANAENLYKVVYCCENCENEVEYYVEGWV